MAKQSCLYQINSDFESEEVELKENMADTKSLILKLIVD